MCVRDISRGVTFFQLLFYPFITSWKPFYSVKWDLLFHKLGPINIKGTRVVLTSFCWFPGVRLRWLRAKYSADIVTTYSEYSHSRVLIFFPRSCYSLIGMNYKQEELLWRNLRTSRSSRHPTDNHSQPPQRTRTHAGTPRWAVHSSTHKNEEVEQVSKY